MRNMLHGLLAIAGGILILGVVLLAFANGGQFVSARAAIFTLGSATLLLVYGSWEMISSCRSRRA